MPTQTPTDADNLLAAVRSEVARIHTSIPGRVMSYDPATQRATVQAVVRSRFRDAATGALTTYLPPAVSNVPVAFPAGADFSITWPLAPGDPVVLVFAERSLDEWRSTGGEDHEPRDVRRFDLSDAIALPGGRSPADPIPAAGIVADTLVIRAGAATIKINKVTGDVEVDGAGIKLGAAAVEALVKADTFRVLYNAHTHPDPTSGTTGPPTVLLTGAEATTKTTGE